MSSNSFIPSWDKGFFKVCFNCFKSFIFKKFNICAAWSSVSSAPLVIAPLWSFLSFLSKSSTPFNPNPGLSSLSIALITFICFSSDIFRSFIIPWTIFLLLTLIINWSSFKPQSESVLDIKLQSSALAWAKLTFPTISKSAWRNSRHLEFPGFSFLKTFWIW